MSSRVSVTNKGCNDDDDLPQISEKFIKIGHYLGGGTVSIPYEEHGMYTTQSNV